MITQEAVLDIAREAIYTTIITSAPLLLISLIFGLIVSIFQTLTFVPKIIAIFLVMMLCGSWMLDTMSGFMTDLWSKFSYYISMG